MKYLVYKGAKHIKIIIYKKNKQALLTKLCTYLKSYVQRALLVLFKVLYASIVFKS